MAKIKYRFSLSQEERDELKGIIAKGKYNAQKVLNALILLDYDEGARIKLNRLYPTLDM